MQEEIKENKELNEENTTDGSIESSSEENTTSNEELEKLRREFLYERAEFENFRKRILKEQETAIKFANERIIREMLMPIDLLDKALLHGAQLKKSSPESKDFLNFLSGVELTFKEFGSVLQRLGVEFIGVAGEEFDPQRHEAVSQVAVVDEARVGKVQQVFQRGCLYHGRLLMPARVAVGAVA